MNRIGTLVAAATWFFAAGLNAAQIDSPTATLTSSVADFEGYTEGQIITNQYSGLLFGQTDGGTPMIDNLPFLFGYAAKSGSGVLTGSADPRDPFSLPTAAGLKIALTGVGSGIEFWLSDKSPLGSYTVSAFSSGGTLLDFFIATPERYVGFSGLAGLSYVTVDSSVVTDSFAIDDVRFSSVPEPGSLALIGIAMASLARTRRKNG